MNYSVHKSNERLKDDLELIIQYKAPIVVSAMGSPAAIVESIHSYGGLVFSDVNSVEHAWKSVKAGADGLVLVAAGAGGQTGEITGFAFVPAVREFFDGPIVLGGGIGNGRAILAAEMLGADFANLGTRFIATKECNASNEYKEMVIDCVTRDIITTQYFTGIRGSYLLPSIIRAGIDPKELLSAKPEINFEKFIDKPKAWKDIWSAGQAVFAVKALQTTAELVELLVNEYAAAKNCWVRAYAPYAQGA